MTTEPEVVPLSPLSFLERAADVFPDKPAITTASGWTQSYSEFRAEAGRVAERLRTAGVGRGDTVAVLARNGPDALLMHYAVPGVKAALVALNTRLAPQEYEYILLDSGARGALRRAGLSERIQTDRRWAFVPDSRICPTPTPLGVEQRSRASRMASGSMALLRDRTSRSARTTNLTPSPSTTRAAPRDDPKGRSTRTGAPT